MYSKMIFSHKTYPKWGFQRFYESLFYLIIEFQDLRKNAGLKTFLLKYFSINSS